MGNRYLEKLVSCLRTLIPLATLIRSTGNWKVSSLADRLNERGLLLVQADNLDKELRRVNMAVAELSTENRRLAKAYEELSAENSRLNESWRAIIWRKWRSLTSVRKL